MRTLPLIAIAALAACSNEPEEVAVQNTEDMPLELEDTGQDVTAIDAATGDDSGMIGGPVGNETGGEED